MRRYFFSVAFIFLLCSLVEYILSDIDVFKWTSIRYCVFLSLLIPFVLDRYWVDRKFVFLQFVLFTVTGISVPVCFKLSKSLKIGGDLIWDEITTSLSIIFLFLLLRVMLELLFDGYPKIKAVITTFLQSIILLPYIIACGYFILTGDYVDVNSLVALYQTNINESIEFMTSSIDLGIVAVIISLLLGIIVLLYELNCSLEVKYISSNKSIAFCLFLSILSVMLFYKVSNSQYFNRLIFDSQEYIQAIVKYKEFRTDNIGNIKKIDVQAKSVPENITYLVIIGESQNKNHMSAYGYERNTTPWAKQMINDENFIFFNNAYACHTLTMKALSQALTESNQYNGKGFATSYSLVDLAKAAGFETYWISNQSKFGSFSTPVSVMAEMADHQIWLNSIDNAGIVYDEEILLNLNKVNNTNNKKVVFIHLMGNHWEYKNRYPKSFDNTFDGDQSNIIEKAKNKQKLNEYDSSMVYNDFVVGKIFEYAKKNWNLYNMIYFSDHSEAVLSDRKHIPGLFEIDMVQIPVYTYFSDEYKINHNTKIVGFREKRDIFFTNDMMFDAVLNIWGLETNLYNSKYDFLSEGFSVKKQDLTTLEGSIKMFE